MKSIIETSTVAAATLLHTLLIAINTHDLSVEGAHKAFNAKLEALESIRTAGFVDLQSGKDKDKAALKGFYPYNLAADTFKMAFLKKSPHATDTQVSARLKQDISSLKRMLQTGRFTSNTGRETPKRELDFAISAQASANMTAFTATLLVRSTEQASKVASKETSELKKQVVKAFESAALISACKDSTEEQKQAEQDKAEALAEQAMTAEQKAVEAERVKAEAKAEQVKAEQVKAEAKAKVERAKAKVESKTTKIKMVSVDAVKSDGRPELPCVDRILKNAVDNLNETEIKELIMKLQAYIA
jgi:hypothetical protein